MRGVISVCSVAMRYFCRAKEKSAGAPLFLQETNYGLMECGLIGR